MVLFCAGVASAFMISLVVIGVLALRNSAPKGRTAVSSLAEGVSRSGSLSA